MDIDRGPAPYGIDAARLPKAPGEQELRDGIDGLGHAGLVAVRWRGYQSSKRAFPGSKGANRVEEVGHLCHNPSLQ